MPNPAPRPPLPKRCAASAAPAFAGDAEAPARGRNASARWGAVLAISFGIFVQIAYQVLPIGLLTPLAADLGVSEGAAGHSMSMTGLFGLISSLLVPALARGMDRRHLLLWLTALMGLSGLLSGLATSFAVYMLSRALLGISVGCFWTMSTAVALRLAPEEKAPQALALFNAGNALAIVVTAPLGSYLGTLLGWRGVFLALVPLALAVFVWQWRSLPALPLARQRQEDFRSMLGLLRRPVFVIGLLAIGLFYAGQFGVFTYVRPYLESVPAITPARLSWVLLAPGVAGLMGSLVISRVLRAGLYRSLIGAPLLLGLTALGFIACQTQLLALVPLLALWGFVATPAPVGWWTWVARHLPEQIDAASGWRVAVIQLSIALGATFGGVLYDRSGYALTFALSAAVLGVAALVAWATQLIQPRLG